MNNNFDLLILNSSIIDGSGNPLVHADIGIKDGNINKIAKLTAATAKEIIDAKGLTASPGFIDIHNHIDHAILAFPNADSYIMQGVTTSLVGNCGLSMAPLNPHNLQLLKKYLTPFLRTDFNYQWDWNSTREYSEKISKKGTAVNLAFLVGQGTLRIAVKGFEMTPATIEEMKNMQNILRKELEEGAFGLSTGLVYPPGSYTSTEELIELTTVLKDYNALYTTHLRNQSEQLIQSTEEAIKIGEANNISVEISHHKAIGKDNWGKVNRSMQIIADARQRGINVNFDVYPYTAAMTTVSSLLPGWVLEGGIENMLQRLEDKAVRKEITIDIAEGRMKGENRIKSIGWKNIVVAECPLDRSSEGKSLHDLFKEFPEPFNPLFDWLLHIKGEATMLFFCMDEEDVRAVIRNPLSMIISDAWVTAPSGGGKPHPRGYGSFPRVISKYVREEKLLTLPEAIRKMTSLPAQKIGLQDRGLIKEGYCADLVLFDTEKIKDMATFENPHQYPQGIDRVIVNGQSVVKNGQITGVKPGKILRRKK